MNMISKYFVWLKVISMIFYDPKMDLFDILPSICRKLIDYNDPIFIDNIEWKISPKAELSNAFS